MNDVQEKFSCNIPVTFVSDGQVMYTLESSKLYLALLRKIISLSRNEEVELNSDHADFLRLVFDHKLMFERHWRKILIDIRDGKLNRHVTVSDGERLAFEAETRPFPLLADQLEGAFRDMGFYKRSTAKDTVHEGFAALKNVANDGEMNEEFLVEGDRPSDSRLISGGGRPEGQGKYTLTSASPFPNVGGSLNGSPLSPTSAIASTFPPNSSL